LGFELSLFQMLYPEPPRNGEVKLPTDVSLSKQNHARNNSYKIPFVILTILVLLLQSGCVSYKKQIFFQGLADTTYNASMQQPDPVIQRGDQLFIMVYATDLESAQLFNVVMGGGQGGGGMNMNMMQQQGGQGGGFMGYLVNEDGEIDFPKFGTLKVLGMTQQDLRDSLQKKLLPFLVDPIVNVRIMNFRVTYITSDRATTTVIMNNKTNILQFLGMVGGVQWMDKRDNIVVIRQVNDLRQIIRINLTDASVFNSPAFYLQPNDVIYVEPNSRKFLETNIQLLSYVTSISSAVSIFLLYLTNFSK
jgi:polysaccharide export outer membrane protein